MRYQVFGWKIWWECRFYKVERGSDQGIENLFSPVAGSGNIGARMPDWMMNIKIIYYKLITQVVANVRKKSVLYGCEQEEARAMY